MPAKQVKLLIIDDSAEDRALLSTRFQQQGYEVTLAADGNEALTMITHDQINKSQPHKFDLVLLDISKLGDDNYHLLHQLKTAPGLSDLPVVVTTTSDDVDSLLKCIDVGAQAAVTLKEKMSKMERDLEIGRQIQMAFLPTSIPQPPGWEVMAHFDPAREVAGDFYDVIPLPQNKLGLVVADVCDKGVGPALFMSLSRSLVRAFSEENRALGWLDAIIASQPASFSIDAQERQMLFMNGAGALLAVEFTNDYIAYNHGDMTMFATLFFGVLDPTSGQLTYINGGHEPPFLVNSAGTIKTRLNPTGPVVGIDAEADFGIGQVTLEPGDLLLIYSDGVPDARDPAGKRFTPKRLASLVGQPAASATALLQRVATSLQSHIGSADQFDDITMLAVWRMPTAGT